MRTSPNGVLAGAIRRAVFHGIACEEFGVYAGFIRSGGLAEKMSNTDDLAAAFATDEQTVGNAVGPGTRWVSRWQPPSSRNHTIVAMW